MQLETHAMINNKGFTLIEFLVAIVILMVGLLGLLSGIDLSLRENVKNAIRSEGILVADDIMMASRAKAFISLSTTAASPPYVFDQSRYPESRRFVRGFYKNYSVQRVVTSKTAQTKEVIVRLAWNYKKQRYTHEVSSFVSTPIQ
jgi:type IV pilus assembly protein PilV